MFGFNYFGIRGKKIEVKLIIILLLFGCLFNLGKRGGQGQPMITLFIGFQAPGLSIVNSNFAAGVIYVPRNKVLITQTTSSALLKRRLPGGGNTSLVFIESCLI